jgi:hypothetical protein
VPCDLALIYYVTLWLWNKLYFTLQCHHFNFDVHTLQSRDVTLFVTLTSLANRRYMQLRYFMQRFVTCALSVIYVVLNPLCGCTLKNGPFKQGFVRTSVCT